MGSRGGGEGCIYRHGLGGQQGTYVGMDSRVGGVEKVACLGMSSLRAVGEKNACLGMDFQGAGDYREKKS